MLVLPQGNGRLFAASATIAVHVALFLVLIIPPAPVVRAVPAALRIFDISAQASLPDRAPPRQPQPKPVPVTPPERVVVPPPEILLPAINPTVVALLEQADAQASAGACDLTAPVQAALQADRAVASALPQIPQARRSVANAIMIWDAGWITIDDPREAPARTAIRDTVAQTVAAASEQCRLQPQGGPRLILIPGQAAATVLALGSGVWRWQDVLDTARPELASPDFATTGNPELKRENENAFSA